MLNNKTPKEFAEELLNTFRPYVHGYVGSSMLSNFEYPDQIEKQSVKVSLLCLEKIRDFANMVGMREDIMFLNATEKELNKILRQL